MKITDAKLDAILARIDRIDRDLRALTTGNYRAADETRIGELRVARNTLSTTRHLVEGAKKERPDARDNY